uniref:CBM1 domain-containing protein n=1 Tax=Pyricularia oryzae (strain P131) TaxID=1143193 RepID=L7JP18_PYRO1
MRTLAPFIATLLVAVTYLQPSLAQGPLPQVYTDPETGIVFNTWSATDGPIQGEGYGSVSLGGFTFGMALPSDALTVDANEFIGYLECSTPTTPGEGWCGVSMGGSMTRALLLVAWPHEDEVLTSFRYATGFVVPELYKGDAKLTQITSSMNSTHYKLVFRCQNCLKWSHDGLEGGQSTSSSFLMLGWGQARTPVGNPECPDRVVIQQHDNGMNLFPAPLDVSIANPSYASWAATATKEVTGDCGGSTEPPVPEVTGVPVPSGTYDYVVVGAGAGGIPIADKLSEAGKSVLLIEKGPPSTGRWGGNLKPSWLQGTDLTRFDVPGLCNQIWVDSNGIACDDTDQMAGCVLGGGTAVNAGLWWKNRTVMPGPFMFANGERGGPLATYLDTASKRSNFKLWMNTAVKRVVREGGHVTGLEVEPFRNGGYVGTVQLTPGTGRVILSAGTFGSAKLLMRSGIGRKDQLEIVKGSRDGPTMVDEASWIPLPVGDNLVDHVNTDTVVSHPNVVFYDFYEAWTSPNPADKDAYLSKRSGILAQAAPNIGPLFFDQIRGADGKTRHIQWTARVEGSLGAPNGKTMTMSQYLGTGSTSRGQMSITSGLSTVVSTHPYLHTEGDKAAVIQGIVNIQNALKGVTGLKFEFPNATTTAADYVASMPVSPSNRRANHWMGTAKLGTDDGRQSGGTAVVDTNTRVFGTDNLFVVDASIFPGMVTTNPSAYIVVASERAAERILALPPSTPLPRYSQCGGRAHTGSFQCAAPYTCQVQNEYYSQLEYK